MRHSPGREARAWVGPLAQGQPPPWPGDRGCRCREACVSFTFSTLPPPCTRLEAWQLVSQERSLGGTKELELKGQHWEATLWCPHCKGPSQCTSEQVWPPCSKQSGKSFPGGLLGRNKLGIGGTHDWADRMVSWGPGGRLSETEVSRPPCQGANTRP